VDYALRRRFAFFDVSSQIGSEGYATYLIGNGVTKDVVELIQNRIQKLNDAIRDDSNLGHGYLIGHSYFVPQASERVDAERYRDIIETEILPLLREYWFDKPDEVAKWRERLLEDV